MKKIAIDFQGGSHGNYLEFVCNKFLAGVSCANSPFNSMGASHAKSYKNEEDKIFVANHYTTFARGASLPSDVVISIKIDYNDLLPLTAISLLRAGDYGYDNQFLEHDTYHKLNNKDYRWVLDNIIDSFFKNQIKDSYDAVRDSSWPDVATINDYKKLPKWIQEECQVVHRLTLLEINENQTDCPRNILREFFKIGFKRPEQSGFWIQQEKMKYGDHCQVIDFPFSAFYDKKGFVDQINSIANQVGYTLGLQSSLSELHDQFLQRQPYKYLKQETDAIFNMIVSGEYVDTYGLNLLQEAYLDAKFELYYNKEAPVDNDRWFSNTLEIKKYYE